jgi:cytochrome c
MIRSVAILVVLTIFTAAHAENSSDDGRMAFNNYCRTCHSIRSGDNRLGPSLAGVVGRKAGSVPGFPYSDSMRNSGVTWDEATLDRFIADTNSVVPNNKMTPFSAVSDPAERAKIVAFLNTLH